MRMGCGGSSTAASQLESGAYFEIHLTKEQRYLLRSGRWLSESKAIKEGTSFEG